MNLRACLAGRHILSLILLAKLVVAPSSTHAGVQFKGITDLDTDSDSYSHYWAQPTLVVIDPAIPDAGQLIAGIRADLPARLLVLDPGVDALSQISRALAECQPVVALHIVSHGSPGALCLGDRRYRVTDLEAARSELATWRRALAPGARIVLYGCEISRGEGRHFLERLAELSGAEISASRH